MKVTAKSIGYWTATGLLVLSIFSGGVAELAHRPETIEGMQLLGYPVYFVVVIGFWKVLASIALVAPGFPRIKEWAYAGVFFNMTGAAVSHLVCGSAGWHVAVMVGLTALTVVSWALRPAGRTLGHGHPVASPASIAASASSSVSVPREDCVPPRPRASA